MSNPSSSGIGQGAAQVFNTSDITNLYGSLLQKRAAEDAAMQQQAAEIMRGYDPNKAELRGKDLSDYNKLYNEYKDIHIQNKGLYRTPLKFQKEYNRVRELEAQMKELKADSKYVYDLTGKLTPEVIKDSDAFEEGSVTAFKQMNNMSVSEIKKQFGGVLPDATMMRRKPVPIDKMKLFGDLQGALDKTAEGYKDSGKLIKWNSDEGKAAGLGTGMDRTDTTRLYDPKAAAGWVGTKFLADANFRNAYKREFETVAQSPEAIGAINQKLSDMYGKDAPQVTDAQSYANADFLINAGTKYTKGDDKLSQDYIEGRKRKDEARELVLHARKTAITKEAEVKAYEDKLKKAKNYKPKTDEEDLKDQVDEAFDILSSGNIDKIDPKTNQPYGEKFKSLFNSTALGMGGKIEIFTPNKNSKQEIETVLDLMQKNPLNGSVKLSDNEKKQLASGKRSFAYISFDIENKDGSTSTKYIPINPYDVQAPAKVYGLLRKGLGVPAKGQEFIKED